MTLAIVYLILAGLGVFFGEIRGDLLALGLSEPLVNIIGKGFIASAGIFAGIRAYFDVLRTNAVKDAIVAAASTTTAQVNVLPPLPTDAPIVTPPPTEVNPQAGQGS